MGWRVSQCLLVDDTVMQGKFWGGVGPLLPTQASPPTVPLPLLPPQFVVFPGMVKLRGHTVSRPAADTALQCPHLTSCRDRVAQSPSFSCWMGSVPLHQTGKVVGVCFCLESSLPTLQCLLGISLLHLPTPRHFPSALFFLSFSVTSGSYHQTTAFAFLICPLSRETEKGLLCISSASVVFLWPQLSPGLSPAPRAPL